MAPSPSSPSSAKKKIKLKLKLKHPSLTSLPAAAADQHDAAAAIRPLKTVLEEAASPYREVAMRLLFTTTLQAGSCRYRIRELEIYAAEDPYTHQGDEQVSSCGGWYFHRTKPNGGGWKGGTFMGMDISFAPVGTAGGILIRGLSRYHQDGKDQDSETYFDGSCNCVRELLRACGVSKIQGLVDKPNFQWSALTKDGIMRLIQHEEPIPVGGDNSANAMEWKACSRVGLSEPAKKPDQLEARQQYHLRPYRFLSAPYETKKEKTKIKNSTVGGVFTTAEFMAMNSKMQAPKAVKSDGDNDDPQDKAAQMKKLFGDSEDDDDDDDGVSGDGVAEDDEESNSDYKPPAKLKKNAILEDTDDDDDDNKEMEDAGDDAHAPAGKATWQYWLDKGMDGKARGWHLYDDSASAKLEGFLQNKGEQLSRTTWHLKSGFFSYEVDISNMTQRNMQSGTVRPIRRVLPGETLNMAEPPIFVPPKQENKKNKASWPASDNDSGGDNDAHKKKKAKTSQQDDTTDLKLEPLFAGEHGYAWEGLLTQVLSSLPKAAEFIGPNRNKEIHPVREMTFRALMALPPQENNLIVFGEAPYPRVESASGIAMFDSLIQNWNVPQFGKTVSMRCIAKAAAIAKGIVEQDAKIADLRKAFQQHDIVTPPQWFQAMLAQGVLLLNASLTIGSPHSKAEHTNFWKPVMKSIVERILQSKGDTFPAGSPKRRLAFLWWGNEALKTKKALAGVLAAFENDVEITHIEHFNPAAQGDKFVQPPNHFVAVNKALVDGGLDPIDWLPNQTWLSEHHCDEHAAFITETQELHKLYLERLQAGLDLTDLAPIVGVLATELCSLPSACDALGLESAAQSAVDNAAVLHQPGLDANEKGAIYLYTTNVLYRRLNEALRHADRAKGKVYFAYLRIFLEAYGKMKPSPRLLYRGIHKDVAAQYKPGSSIIWWTISSCTPNIHVAKGFGGGGSAHGTLFHVKTATAVPIMHLSAFQSEEEYVLAPGTVLKVVKVEKKPNEAAQIFLEEVQGKRWVS